MKLYKSSCPQIRIVSEPSPIKKAQIKSSSDIAAYVRQFYSFDIDIYESVFLLLLNQANNTIGWVKISQGGLTGSVCDPILVAKYAIEHLAKNVVLVHNHPSGNLTPSRNDEELTNTVKSGLALFGIRLLDHLILTSDGYYSFSDEGML